VEGVGEMINIYEILISKREGKRTLRRPGSRWWDFKVYLREKVWTGSIWLRIGLMNLRVT
jgi:hypothetical protein